MKKDCFLIWVKYNFPLLTWKRRNQTCARAYTPTPHASRGATEIQQPPPSSSSPHRPAAPRRRDAPPVAAAAPPPAPAAPPARPLQRCRRGPRGPAPAPTEWTKAPVASVRAATADASLFHVSLDLSAHGPLLASHVAAGQFLPFRLPAAPYPIFLAISSPPPASSSSASPPRSFDFLVKRLPGTPSARLCDLRPGDLVPVGGSVVGRGFEVRRIADARHVLVFATGSGISPIWSLIESGFGENEKINVNLFYGVRNLQRMAYQERFSYWESRGIKIIPVLSRPDDQWTGQRGYVQNAFSRAKKVINPSSTGAILCGHKQMTEEITRALVADGMSKDKILTNF